MNMGFDQKDYSPILIGAVSLAAMLVFAGLFVRLVRKDRDWFSFGLLKWIYSGLALISLAGLLVAIGSVLSTENSRAILVLIFVFVLGPASFAHAAYLLGLVIAFMGSDAETAARRSRISGAEARPPAAQSPDAAPPQEASPVVRAPEAVSSVRSDTT